MIQLTGLNDSVILEVVAAPDASSRRRELAAGTLTDTSESGPASIGPEFLHPSVYIAYRAILCNCMPTGQCYLIFTIVRSLCSVSNCRLSFCGNSLQVDTHGPMG